MFPCINIILSIKLRIKLYSLKGRYQYKKSMEQQLQIVDQDQSYTLPGQQVNIVRCSYCLHSANLLQQNLRHLL